MVWMMMLNGLYSSPKFRHGLPNDWIADVIVEWNINADLLNGWFPYPVKQTNKLVDRLQELF